MRHNLGQRLCLHPSSGCHPQPEPYDADIIILSLNRVDETLDALRSVQNQRGVKLHITVLDQGSDRKTVDTLKAAGQKMANFGFYEIAENVGVPGGRNLAASLGHGRIIVALDNDAVFANPFVVAGAIRAFDRRPDLGALGFNVLCADGVHVDQTSWGYPTRLLSKFRERFDTTTFVGAGHAIRRTTWNLVGGYDPSLYFTWEEYDFCLAAIALNWSISYDGSLTVIHKVSSEARVPWNGKRMTYFVRNRLIIGRKWSQSWISLAPRILGYAIKGILNKQVEATFTGIRTAWSTNIPNRRKMTRAMRNYIRANEGRYRGSLFDRIRDEILGRRHADPWTNLD